ncbi:uncharacterized protein LOC135489198 [Lineus longissimus]|uniref:uncharacterized protein LOC135489198 n=1 Tax=Lineus longissimus TaxID=88925 RepID=UPI002B4E9A5C
MKMPKGKKKGKGKGKKKGKKGSAGKKSTPETVPIDPIKPQFVAPLLRPGETLLKVLTTHQVQEKEIHNFKVSVKVLEELTPQEIRELRTVFETFDGNMDGFLNPIELRNAMKVLGFKVTRDEVKDMSSECTKRGMCDFSEYLGFVIERQGDTRDIQEEILKGFKLLDFDNSSKITLENLKQATHETGVAFTEEDLKDMIMEADTNGDGVVDKDEFIRIMLQTNLF